MSVKEFKLEVNKRDSIGKKASKQVRREDGTKKSFLKHKNLVHIFLTSVLALKNEMLFLNQFNIIQLPMKFCILICMVLKWMRKLPLRFLFI